MRNCEVTQEGDDLVIRVNLTKRLGPSKSGKTEIVGSTDGIHKVRLNKLGDYGVGVNVFTDRKLGGAF